MGSSHTYYDETLTQNLWNKFVNDNTSHVYYSWRLGSYGTLQVTGSHGSSSQFDGDDVYYNYMNFRAINGVDFAHTVDSNGKTRGPGTFDLWDNTSMTNVTLNGQGIIARENVKLENITYQPMDWYGGWVTLAGAGATLNNLTAPKDYEEVVLAAGVSGGSISAANISVGRRLWSMTVGSGSTYAANVSIGGVVKYVNVGAGAVLNSLTVGSQRSWAASDTTAFCYYDSSWDSWTHSSATQMEVGSGGTATNIYLGNGGDLYVSGPSDTVTSQYNSATNEWVYSSHFGSGRGGVVENLQMATGSALKIDGVTDVRAIWNYPTNGYGNSSSYMSGFLATAPQSAYVQFQSNTVGRNITIGNGGTMTVGPGASVTNISMGALTTSTYYTNKSGNTDVWVGDRGAKLTVNGGFTSDVIVEAAPMTFDYYSAAHDYFWLYSSSIMSAYSSAHGSYGSGSAWSSSIYNSAVSGYRQYMSGMYTSGAVYTNYGDDTGYDRKWVGGEVGVYGGAAYNLSGFAYLAVTGDASATSQVYSGGDSAYHYSAYSTDNVSKASGVVSARIRAGAGAHLTSVTAPGGHVVLNSGIYRMTDYENPQSNFTRIEHLNLRTSGLVGDNNSAVIFFEDYLYGSGNFGVPVVDSNGHPIDDPDTWGYKHVYYRYDTKDPGEVVYASGDSGLTVQGTYGKFTYTGSGAIVFGGLGTVAVEEYDSRCYNSSGYYSSTTSGTSSWVTSITRWLAPAVTHYEFGVLKGVYDEETGGLAAKYVYDGEGGFDWKGVLAVGSGAVVEGIGSKAALYTANDLTSDSWNPVIDKDLSKMLYVVAGGSADNITVQGKVKNYEVTSKELYRGNAALVVSTGGTATNVRVLSDGIAMAVGGTIDKVFVDNGGILYLSGWGGAWQVSPDNGSTIAGPQHLDTTVLNAVQLNAGGQLGAVYDYQFGGKAPSIIANSGGGILNGVTANGVAYASGVDFAGNLTLAGGQKGLDLTVRGCTKVTARDSAGNPTAWTTTIATLNVSSGGSATGTTVAEEGAIYVSEGAVVNSTIIASGGRMIFENPGSGWGNYLPASAIVDGIDIQGGGILQINSKYAVSATDVKINESAGLEFYLVKDASEEFAKTELNGTWTASWGNGTFHTNDGVLTGFGGEFGYEYVDPIYSRTYTSARLSMYIRDNAVLSGGDIRGYGYFTATSGGKVLGTRIRGVTANIGASGYASGLTATVASTGSAYDTNIYVYGSGALAEKTTLSGGYLGVENHGVASGVTMLAPEGYAGPMGNQNETGPAELEIMAGGTAKDVVASAGVITMYEGSKDPGTASPKLSNADIHYSATLVVNCDGAVLDGTLNLGGLVTTTATRYEYVEVQVTDPATGNIDTQWQRIEKNNAVAVADTLTVNFDLTERDGSDEDAMIDNLANLAGATLGTITVAADQAAGKYVLAQGAESFTGTLSVKCGDEVLGNLGIGKYMQVGADTVYSLTNNADEGLCFTVFAEVGAAVDKIVATVGGRELKTGEWVNQTVTVKAYGNQYSKSLWYRIRKAVATRSRGADDDWTQITDDKGITITECCDIDFKVKNDQGEDSKITTYTVNYDDAPAEVFGVQFAAADPAKPYLDSGDVCTVAGFVTDDWDDTPTVALFDGADWNALAVDADGSFSFNVTGNGAYQLRTTDHAGNVAETAITVDAFDCPAVEVTATGATWEGRPETPCTVAVGDGEGEAVLPVEGNAVRIYNAPAGCTVNVGYADEDNERAVAIPDAGEYAPALWQAEDDGVTDVFFAQANGTWKTAYMAQHVGSVNDWAGTQESVDLGGKNKLCDFFAGATTDANVLLLTDDENGDALFVDDVYTALPGELTEQQSRIARIREIRAGAGNDVVDLTSQRFEYVGEGLTVRGGDGDDVIWANKGDNKLFGDAGNDRLVGASGNDVLAGGAGNDRMHGGGGNDLFVFGPDWGMDTVEQLAEGAVTLWFATGTAENWNAETLTYADGTNRVTVTGVTADDITLKFGDDGSAQYTELVDAGAFAAFTSENVFEKKGVGALA